MITTAELVKKVRRLVNEAESDAAVSVVTADYRSLDDCIVALLPQAVSLVQKMKSSTTEAVNVKILSPAVIGITDNGDGTGCMPLPNDYFGPVVVQLEGGGDRRVLSTSLLRRQQDNATNIHVPVVVNRFVSRV